MPTDANNQQMLTKLSVNNTRHAFSVRFSASRGISLHLLHFSVANKPNVTSGSTLTQFSLSFLKENRTDLRRLIKIAGGNLRDATGGGFTRLCRNEMQHPREAREIEIYRVQIRA
jgi:hypothetical protein